MTNTRGRVTAEFLGEFLRSGGRITRCNFVFDGEVLERPIFVLGLEQGGHTSLLESPWTPELEEFLLGQNQKCASIEEEANRFANILSSNLAAMESKHGDDYARRAFAQVLREDVNYKELPILQQIRSLGPPSTSKIYGDCAKFLRNALDGLHNSSVVVNYGPSGSKVVGEGLTAVLDDRFHVSLRAYLFQK